MSYRRPPRAPGFLYVGIHRYFLTICVFERRPAFADLASGRWVIDQLFKIASASSFAVIAYCVMPDHVHALVEGQSEAADLKSLMHRWKLTTSYAWKQRAGVRLWQEGYFDHVLRAEDSLPAVVRYILNNPIRAGLVASAADYPLVGSDRYSLASLADAASDWKPRSRHHR